MSDEPVTRIRVNAAAVVQPRGCVLVAGQLLAGSLRGKLRARSATKGDAWQVEEAMVFGADAPTAYDLHEGGKCHLTFRPVAHLRVIEEGEEFVAVQGQEPR